MSYNYPQRIGNWWLIEPLGSGFSGAIFRAKNIYTGEIKALKIQDVNHECPTNRFERFIYPLLQGGKGMPTLWASGTEGKWDFLVIDLLGASLDNLFRRSGQKTMDLRSVCCIAMQVISRMETMHNRGVLHRDIQLGNCVLGLPPYNKTIYMIDFGFSKQYIDPYSRRHIPDSNQKRDFIGNYWFTSVNVHCRGKVPSRRDDLEAAALMLIHLLTPGGLPWTRNGVPKTDLAHNRLIRTKRQTRPEDLCRGLPSEFEDFLRYCRGLGFTERPDYQRWIGEFKDLMIHEYGGDGSDAFVWPPPSAVEIPKTLPPPAQSHKTQAAKEVEKILNDLAVLKLHDSARQVLGDRKNLQQAVRDQKSADKKANEKGQSQDEQAVIVISSGTESSDQSRDRTGARRSATNRLPKAAQFSKLALDIGKATDNAQLSKLVRQFAAIIESYTSKTLTKEGFAVLDALYKHLTDPSVFVVGAARAPPARTTRSADSSQDAENQTRAVKMNKLWNLRKDVQAARSSRSLAKMVAEFGAITDRSSGRTVTKDGLAFLDGLASRLQVLQ